jgi:hypothetical protein
LEEKVLHEPLPRKDVNLEDKYRLQLHDELAKL